ncbi:hypothetical protein ACFV23_49600, partial [Streptomyces sp. NPDC059627]
MRILVLGRTGYLGTHVAAGLRAVPGAQVLGGGRSAGAEHGVEHRVDLATVRPEQLAKTLAGGGGGPARPRALVERGGGTARPPARPPPHPPP